MIAALALYSVIEGDLASTLRFMFVFDAAQLTPRVALEALGLGFFSIGVGLCMLITYAAYAGTHIGLPASRGRHRRQRYRDLVHGRVRGISLVFAENLDPSGGPGLVFTTLTIAFARMPFGTIAAAVFFSLLPLQRSGRRSHSSSSPSLRSATPSGWSRARASFACGAGVLGPRAS